MLKLKTKVGASLTSSILLWLSWPAGGFAPLLFIAFVPLLWVENYFVKNPHLKKKKFFGLAYFSMLLWNTLSTWWVCNASAGGGVFAITCNSLFMAIILYLFHCTHRKFKSNLAYFSLPVYWIAFEYLHLHWEASWPWLTLGNGFATVASWVQWYEFTGVLGGSLWIWIVNILIFLTIKQELSLKRIKTYYPALFIIIPLGFSLIRYYSYKEKTGPVNIVVTQPNIDPYNEKFSGLSNEEQLIRILQLANLEVNDSTDYVLAPETAIPYSMWEDELNDYNEIKIINHFLNARPRLKILIGASTNKAYPDGEKSATARRFKDKDAYYDSYNTALHFEKDKPIQLFHKSKLVPGVEKMPYPQLFGFLQDLAIDMGGTSGSLGVQDEPSVFSSSIGKVAPVICYESVYGEYVAEYILKGAQWIAIITNDGWWGDTPGYRQHVQYARLRAVEVRRSIARSANTGVSCFINQSGDISQATPYWQDAVISQTINKNDDITFYTKHGDYIGWFAAMLFFPLLIITIAFKSKSK